MSSVFRPGGAKTHREKRHAAVCPEAPLSLSKSLSKGRRKLPFAIALRLQHMSVRLLYDQRQAATPIRRLPRWPTGCSMQQLPY